MVWRQTPKVDGDGHFSHRLAFSPDGEHLFVSSGDRQLGDPAQDTSNTLGTIVRLTPDGEPAPGNPLADRGGVSAEIWSWGHRNPLGLEHAPDGTLWSSEMGPEGGDELNVIEAGSNYGWPEASDGSDYGGGEIPDHAEGDGYAAPARSWNPEHLAGKPDGLRRRAVRGLAGRRVPRRAVGGGAGARRPRRPDRGRDGGLRHGGSASAPSRKAPTARSGCSRTRAPAASSASPRRRSRRVVSRIPPAALEARPDDLVSATVTESMISARGLRKSFGDFEAVKGIDVEVRRGEAFGFLGPNGAGKSSTMRMIASVSPVTSGELRILGMDPATDGPAIRGRLGVCPQEDTLDNELNVFDNLYIYGRYFGIDRATCRERAAGAARVRADHRQGQGPRSRTCPAA